MSRAELFRTRGVVMIEHALSSADLARMGDAFAAKVAGRRQALMPRKLTEWLCTHETLSTLTGELAGRPAQLVRVVAFDKTPSANWFVPWHQDRTIVVERRQAIAGYDHWTEKESLIHVEPPISLLDGMVTLRIHLDDASEDNGPLEVIPGTHEMGRLDRAAVQEIAARQSSVLCLAVAGDILAMRPLLIHRSQRARLPTRRRVLHLEYAIADLPAPLAWAGALTAATA